MPQTKPKPAAATEAQPMQPEPPKPTPRELRKAETQRQFQVLNHVAKTFWEDIGLHKFQALVTFKLILDRDGGSNTALEHFLVSLIHLYEDRDDDGEGLTLDDIQWAMKQHLTDDDALSGAIEDAHFLANRYLLPESSKEPVPENSSQKGENVNAKNEKNGREGGPKNETEIRLQAARQRCREDPRQPA